MNRIERIKAAADLVTHVKDELWLHAQMAADNERRHKAKLGELVDKLAKANTLLRQAIDDPSPHHETFR
jgi:hypothetical protein